MKRSFPGPRNAAAGRLVVAGRGLSRLWRLGPWRICGRHLLVAVIGLLLLSVWPLRSAAAQTPPSESDIEDGRRLGALHSSLPPLSRHFFSIVDFGDVRLVCPAAVVEGDLVRCLVADYTLVGKRFVTLVLANLFRLPTPMTTASASSSSVGPEVLESRFESTGFAVESDGYWWVFVQTVNDDSCDPKPYSLDVDVTAGRFVLEAAVTVLDDGDPVVPGESGEECVVPARLEALDASASEGDGTLVFTARATESAPQADVRVDYALAPGSAGAASDYSDVSGTLMIPAGARHATVSVSLVDDAVAEGNESFGLVLSNPVGATLADASASAVIVDDDAGAVPAVTPSAAVCGDVVLSGRVSGVFDVVQLGFAGNDHVFVDVDVTCPAVGSPVGVSVVGGPRASLGASAYCLAESGGRTVTTSAAAAIGCETFAVPRPVGGTVGGRSTHLLRVPDASIGQAHQLLVWVDADGDRVHDRGEPYQYVAADFVARSVGGATLSDFGLVDDFDVELVGGSDRVGRVGQGSELRLRLYTTPRVERSRGEPVDVASPLAGALVGVNVAAGPSAGAEVMCLSPTGATSRCRTDADGQVIVRYEVGSTAASVLRRTEDVLAVFHDPDQDGRRALGAPTIFLARPVAKTVSYVALGDSYSSGEAGEKPPLGTSYQSGVSSADGHCRRWSEAYPNVFAEDVLRAADPGIDLEFRTFAYTGATTRNIHDPRGPGNGITQEDLIDTNKPSHVVPSLRYDSDTGELLPPPGSWEPRQAASLAATQGMADVDMITVTIGGNDAGFADVLRKCVLGGRDCGRGNLPDDYDEIPARLTALLTELRRTAPNASIFMLGYPHITPEPIEANRLLIDYCGLPGKPLHASGVSRSPLAAAFHRLLGGTISDLAVSFSEARFLWDSAEDLNAKLKRAATASGVHFVDVADNAPAKGPPSTFVGHTPCSSQPRLNGFIAHDSLIEPISSRSFHPNQAGQRTLSTMLEEFVLAQIGAGVALSESGLPINPEASE